MEILKEYYPMVVGTEVIDYIIYHVPRYGNNMTYQFCYPFNHYESPYVSAADIENNNKFIDKDELVDIDLNMDFQIEFFDKLLKYRHEFYIKYSRSEFRFETFNSWFDDSDATLLYAIMREYIPKRIIEIGSGFSTCMMLDTNEYWLGNETNITCIEPFPSRLYQNIRDNDNISVYEDFVQNIPLSEFEALGENDILFIDSSHVIKPGGDIPYEYFEILPRLKKGVLIHIHDIFKTFSYPLIWLRQGRAYTEGFLLRALLMNTDRYEIVYFNNLMANKYEDEYVNSLNGGGRWSNINKKCQYMVAC